MKSCILVIFSILTVFTSSHAQNYRWEELETGSYVLDPFGILKIDPFDTIFMVNYPYYFHSPIVVSEQNVYLQAQRDILKIDEKKVDVLTAGLQDLTDIIPDGTGDYYVTLTQYFSALFHATKLKDSALIAYTSLEYNISCYSDWKGNIYVFFQSEIMGNSVRLKKWDGAQWSHIDFKGSPGMKYAFCTDSVENIIVSGTFEVSDGRHFHLAKYDGNSWLELGSDTCQYKPNGFIHSMISDKKGNIYAAGKSKDGDKHYVAKWDGHTWLKLGEGVSALNANGAIRCIALDMYGNVYAAGNFTNDKHLYYVAKWNGTSWIELGALNANKPITSICINSNNTVFVKGEFTNAYNNRYVAVFKQN